MAKSISPKDVDEILNSTIGKVESTSALPSRVKDPNAGKVRFVKAYFPFEKIILPNGKEINLYEIVNGKQTLNSVFYVSHEEAKLVREVANKYKIVE